MSFNKFILKEQYEKVKGLGDRLELMKEQIAWEPFVPLISKIFHGNEKGYKIKKGVIQDASFIEADVGNHLIRELEATTASLHDGEVDFAKKHKGQQA